MKDLTPEQTVALIVLIQFAKVTAAIAAFGGLAYLVVNYLHLP